MTTESAAIVRDVSRSGSHTYADVTIDWAANCDLGLVRQTNEDAALAAPGCYLLADGMGGHDSGEIASETALLTLAQVEIGADWAQSQERLDALLGDAQNRIAAIDSESGRLAGTTATGAVLVTDEGELNWLVFNIGDSRTYLFSKGTFTSVTTDHSQVQELVSQGLLTEEEARTDARRNVITRALGAGMAEPQADYYRLKVTDDDVLLLCSDGLNGELPDSELEAILTEFPEPAEAADALVEATRNMGAHDNVTVLVLRTRTATSEGG